MWAAFLSTSDSLEAPLHDICCSAAPIKETSYSISLEERASQLTPVPRPGDWSHQLDSTTPESNDEAQTGCSAAEMKNSISSTKLGLLSEDQTMETGGKPGLF